MDKQYTVKIVSRDPRPRSKRLREQGIGIVANSAILAGSSTGDSHTHENKQFIDQITTDQDNYLFLTQLRETTDPDNGETISVESISEKVKAGYADSAYDLLPESPFISTLNSLFCPCDENREEISWAAATLSDGKGGILAKSLKAKVGLWTEQFFSARGYNSNESGGTGGGASMLSMLDDVLLKNPQNGDALVYDATVNNGNGGWVNSAVKTGLDESALSQYLTTNNYATRDWVNSQGFLKSHQTINYLVQAGVATSLNFATTTDGRMTLRLVSNDTTVGRPVANGYVLNFNWVSMGNWGSQLYIPHNNGSLQWRPQAGSEWNTQAWHTIIDTTNYTSLLDSRYVLASSLANYVTLDTAQEIKGEKTFDEQTAFNAQVRINGTNNSYADLPELRLHIPNITWVKFKMDSNTVLHLLNGSDTTWGSYAPLKASSFIKAGGTSSQFLKADGTVDSNSYALASSLGNYLPNRDGVVYAKTTNGNEASLVYNQGGSNKAAIGYNSTTGTFMYDATSGSNLRLKDGVAYLDNYTLLHTGNFATTLDNSYVKKSGDTITGELILSDASLTVSGTYGTITVNVATNNFFGPTIASNNAITLGRDSSRWSNVYANTINVSSTALVSNLNADMLDGYHISSVMAVKSWLTSDTDANNIETGIDLNATGNGSGNTNFPGNYGVMATFKFNKNYWFQLHSSSGGALQFRSLWINGTYSGWKTLAFTDSNVASASKLETARTLWGQSFNGENNISGALTGVGNISPLSDNAYAVGASGNGFAQIWSRTFRNNRADDVWIINDNSSYGINLRIGTTDVLTVASSLNVGIGNPNPVAKLDVSGGIHATAEIMSDGDICATGTVAADGLIYTNFGILSNDFIYAIGTISTDDVVFANTGIWTNGYSSARGQNTSSDERLKTIVRPITIDVRDLAGAPSVLFRWKSDGREDVGSIAQYFQKINPLFTPVMPDGYLSLQYGKTALIGLISVARSVLCHEERIAHLERENKELKQIIQRLKAA